MATVTEEKYVVEEFELSSDGEDEENAKYGDITDEDISSDEEDGGFEATVRSVEILETKNIAKKDTSVSHIEEISAERRPEVSQEENVRSEVNPSVIDDFVRNFLIQRSMMDTLNTFNREWYERRRNQETAETEDVPDIYLKNQKLERDLKSLKVEVDRAKALTAKAQGTWNKFRKERDFHRMHHRRVVQEKERLVTDIKRLKKHFSSFEPSLKTMRKKYETAMKDNMLLRLERDRLRDENNALKKNDNLSTKMEGNSASKDRRIAPGSLRSKTKKKRDGLSSSKKRTVRDTNLPTGDGSVNPYLKLEFDAPDVSQMTLEKTFKAHRGAISSLAFHPKKAILATASDDATWKLWSLPAGELIMSGEGHRDWIADVAFSPLGSQLMTASGDSDVKVWDFKTASCVQTFRGHTQAAWGVAYHHEGDFAASCSMDQTVKLWDLHSSRCRQTFRGHVDSVNAICFQPFANNICTASGDKTVSLWDIRSGLCVQTFYGHENSVNALSFALSGLTIASGDADGVVRMWDVRKISQIAKVDAGPHPINSVHFDRSEKMFALASDDGTVKVYEGLGRDSASPKVAKQLDGHGDAVQAVMFDPLGKFIVSGSSDCTFRLWS